ncbi:MAG: VIT1/CCC1 transporter family protein [archaeon]|nr:VIT1/CCC1 transporter family protein [archaeon]
MAAKKNHESHATDGKILEDVIWGGQDGLVNVLGLILGVAAATSDSRIVIIAGLAATFAESISMAAVAYTSQKAGKQFLERETQREMREIEETPETEKLEIREIFEKKGFRGKDLDRAVEIITSDKKVWLETMISEELKLGSYDEKDPLRDGIIVGVSALVGSLVPLAPFFFLEMQSAFVFSIGLSILVLFGAGAVKAKKTIGDWRKSGLEMAAIGTLSAIAGYAVGILLKAP